MLPLRCAVAPAVLFHPCGACALPLHCAVAPAVLFLPCGACALPLHCAVAPAVLFLPCGTCALPCTELSPLPCCFSLVELVRSPALCLVRTAFAMRGILERRSPLFGALKALKTLRVLKNHRFSNTPNISNTSNTPKIHPLAARMMDFPHR